MASTEFGTGKSIIVLAIVVGCFAILWPKIFYPMMQAAFSMTAPKLDNDGDLCQVMFEHTNKGEFFYPKLCEESITYEDVFSSLCNSRVSHEKLFSAILEECEKEIGNFCKSHPNVPDDARENQLQERDKSRKYLNECLRRLSQKIYDRHYFKKLFKKFKTDKYTRKDRPPHLNPGNVNTRMKEKMGGTRHAERLREGKPFPHPSARHPPKPQPKSGGAMSIIMPIYTIGIVVFFLYTVLKLVFKKQPLEDKKPMVKDFHMDPEYHKYVLRDEYAQKKKPETETANRPKPEKVEPVSKENEDYEIYQLRKRLQEMEATMERIVSHMGAVSDCIAANIHANIPSNADSVSTASSAVSEIKLKEKQLIEQAKISASVINDTLKQEQNLKSCIDLSPTVESYEIIGNSYPTTPDKEVKQININEAQMSQIETSPLTEDAPFNENKLPLHHDTETIDISSNQQSETASFDRESSVASEGSSFELLCHSRDTRSLSPAGCDENSQKEDFVGMTSKTDSLGSIDNISFEHFSPDTSDQQETTFDSFIISDSQSASDKK